MPPDRALIDWLPHFDARLLPAIHRAFGPQTKLVIVERGERAALLDWLAYGGAHGWRVESIDAAREYLKHARAHLELARTDGGMPVLVLDADSVVRDPVDAVARLARFLELPIWTPGAAHERAATALGGLPAELPAGRDGAYTVHLS